jgi:arginase
MTLSSHSEVVSLSEFSSPSQKASARHVSVLGVPLGYGAGTQGVDAAPAALRAANIVSRIAALGWQVSDAGDVPICLPSHPAQESDNPKYLPEMVRSSQAMIEHVQAILAAGALPVMLGGDHSVAIGTQSGVATHFHERGESLGLIWFDAHADMNTPHTSPSGNMHGMPLAILLGYGESECVNLSGFAPKFDPRLCVHIGARDIDQGERALIHQLGMRFFTMRDIDERGMRACMDEALAIVSQASAGYSVTFDIDVVDPFDAPGSGTLVRGGLTYREAHLALEKIADNGKMRALELVELNPSLDVNQLTTELSVELLLSALGKTIL